MSAKVARHQRIGCSMWIFAQVFCCSQALGQVEEGALKAELEALARDELARLEAGIPEGALDRLDQLIDSGAELVLEGGASPTEIDIAKENVVALIRGIVSRFEEEARLAHEADSEAQQTQAAQGSSQGGSRLSAHVETEQSQTGMGQAAVNQTEETENTSRNGAEEAEESWIVIITSYCPPPRLWPFCID